MSPRLVPALGLATACAMLTGVGVIAISMGSGAEQPTEIAGAVVQPSSSAPVHPSTVARQAKSNRAVRSVPTSTPRTSVSAAQPPAGRSTSFSSNPPASPAVPVESTAPPSASGPAGPSPAMRNASSPVASQYAQAVFDAVNQARAAHHLPALLWSANLQVSSHRHNLAMAAANTLSHQVDGEPALGARETAAGAHWTYAAENVAWTTDRSQQGALDIEARMYGETAPNDAHKQNILSRSATAIGIDVYLDAAHGRLWLTEDFSG